MLNGIDSVQKVLQYFRDQRKNQEVIDGYYGTLIENFNTEKTFFTSVEVTAGNRSVHFVITKNRISWELTFLEKVSQY